MNYVLIGMPGAGKTTVGKLLSHMTGRRFADTDEVLAARFGDISALFSKRGEAFFRAEERKLCREISEKDGLIIATGGGTISDPENIAALRQNGTLIFLRARVETLVSRLQTSPSRPLLQGDLEERLRHLEGERGEQYLRAAHLVIDTDGLSLEAVAQKVLEGIA